MISVVIPVRNGGTPAITLAALRGQTYQNFEVIVSLDQVANANVARNAGAALATGQFLLFSDDDIQWASQAIGLMRETLLRHPEAAYCWGSYCIGDERIGHRAYNPRLLEQRNYIPTMAMLRRETFPGFDERIRRLQDWDLWLTMLERGHQGIFCGTELFRTEKRKGISFGGDLDWQTAEKIVRIKHGLA